MNYNTFCAAMVAKVCLVELFPLESDCLSRIMTDEYISVICLLSKFASTSTFRYLNLPIPTLILDIKDESHKPV